MSIEALSMVLNHSKAMGSPKVVLLGIANHLGPDATEGAWPSQKRLADYANLSERGVQKCVDKLVKSGELRVEVAGGHSRNQYKPNRYWITIECPSDCDRSMSHRRGEPADQGRTPVPSGANAGTVRGEPEFVQTVIEPEEEPIKQNKSRQVPSDWKPSEKFADECNQKFPTLTIANEVEAFIDYHTANGSTFKDFNAAFRTWCRNAVKFQAPKTVIHQQQQSKSPHVGGPRDWVREMHDMGEHFECRKGEFGCK
jgi:hypothetical protein